MLVLGNRVIKIVETGLTESGNVDIRKNLDVQEFWLDAEEVIANGKQYIHQNKFVNAIKLVMHSLLNSRVEIHEYNTRNIAVFEEYGKQGRRRGYETLRALERDFLYRNVYNPEQTADESPEYREKIKDNISFFTGVDKTLFSNKVTEGYTELTPGKLGLTDERIDKLLSGGYYGSSNPDYAQAYIAYMSPDDFLKLTTGKNQRALERIKTWGLNAPPKIVHRSIYGMLYIADIYSFEEIHSEIEKIVISDKLIENWTYPLIHPKLIEEAQRRGFL